MYVEKHKNKSFPHLTKLLTKPPFIYIMNKATEKNLGSGGVKMKRTYQPNNRRRSKKIGFLARAKSSMIKRRRRKGRKVLAH